MGSSYSGEYDRHLREYFRVVKTDHGCTFLEEKHSGREFLLKEFSTNSNEQFMQLQMKLKMRQINSHPHVLSVYDVTAKTQNTICSHVHRLFMIVEYPFRTLQGEVEERRRKREYFTENEIWCILYSCCIGLGHLYGHGLKHQALTPGHIYIEGQGLIRISDPELLNQPTNLSAYHTLKSKRPLNSKAQQPSHLYLSPQQLQCLQHNRMVQYSPQSSDIFTLGMVALECMYLENMEGIYDDYKVSQRRLQEVLAGAKKLGYGDVLNKTVGRMVRIEPRERIGGTDIEKLVESNRFQENGDSRRAHDAVNRRDSIKTNSNSSRRLEESSRQDIPQKKFLQKVQSVQNFSESPSSPQMHFINRDQSNSLELNFINRPQKNFQLSSEKQNVKTQKISQDVSKQLSQKSRSTIVGQPFQQNAQANPINPNASASLSNRFSQDTLVLDPKQPPIIKPVDTALNWQSKLPSYQFTSNSVSPFTQFPINQSTPLARQSNPVWQPTLDITNRISASTNNRYSCLPAYETSSANPFSIVKESFIPEQSSMTSVMGNNSYGSSFQKIGLDTNFSHALTTPKSTFQTNFTSSFTPKSTFDMNMGMDNGISSQNPFTLPSNPTRSFDSVGMVTSSAQNLPSLSCFTPRSQPVNPNLNHILSKPPILIDNPLLNPQISNLTNSSNLFPSVPLISKPKTQTDKQTPKQISLVPVTQVPKTDVFSPAPVNIVKPPQSVAVPVPKVAPIKIIDKELDVKANEPEVIKTPSFKNTPPPDNPLKRQSARSTQAIQATQPNQPTQFPSISVTSPSTSQQLTMRHTLSDPRVQSQEQDPDREKALQQLLQQIQADPVKASPAVVVPIPLTSDTPFFKPALKKNQPLDIVNQTNEENNETPAKPGSPISELDDNENKEKQIKTDAILKIKEETPKKQASSNKKIQKVHSIIQALDFLKQDDKKIKQTASAANAFSKQNLFDIPESSDPQRRSLNLESLNFVKTHSSYEGVNTSQPSKPDQWKRQSTDSKKLKKSRKSKINKDGSVSFGEESDKSLAGSQCNQNADSIKQQQSAAAPPEGISLSKFRKTNSQQYYDQKKQDKKPLIVQQLTIFPPDFQDKCANQKANSEQNSPSNVSEDYRSSLSKNDQPEYSEQTYEGGNKYEGYKVKGMKHGFGKFSYADGGHYQGEWKHNTMDGFGKLYYPNGEVAYQGYWLDNKFHGRGRMLNNQIKQLDQPFDYRDFCQLGDCWVFYDGMFENDVRNGPGLTKLSNGQQFEGVFSDDIVQGLGKFTCLDGSTIEGIWKGNQLVQQF